MSYITDVVIYGAKKEAMDNVNAWLQENDPERHQALQPLDVDVAGGSKFFTSSIYAAAFNYMPLDLIDLLKKPETWLNGCLGVIVMVDGENGTETFMFGYVKDEKGPVCRGISTCEYDFG